MSFRRREEVLFPGLFSSGHFGHWSFLLGRFWPVNPVLLGSQVFSTLCHFYPGFFRHWIPLAACRFCLGSLRSSVLSIPCNYGRGSFLPCVVFTQGLFGIGSLRSQVFSVRGFFRPRTFWATGSFGPYSFRPRVISSPGFFRPWSIRPHIARPRVIWITSFRPRFVFNSVSASGPFDPVSFLSSLDSSTIRLGPLLFLSKIMSVPGVVSILGFSRIGRFDLCHFDPGSFLPWVFSA